MLRNGATSWGAPARSIHWLAALLILALLGHGWWMTEFAPRAVRFGHYQTHASIGYALIALIALIALTLVRLVWRWLNEVPALPQAAPWERVAAVVGHWGLYVLMLASALSGWALAGTFRQPLDSFFGWFAVPRIASGNSLHKVFEESHQLLSWTLALLVVVHIASAVYHWLWKKDDVMQRMLR